ncbi:TonB family protein [Microcoleus sp. FACHB-1515]|uniref:TonB family protein n=1 Tax=Cyanophyceae TaxID=3028117 RepID=UPI0016822FB9|nr:TonB family protein [Microcoleus sp. FACHB-1515]MBD2089021.1 TonB family protein [Microcoleus sp. FACHB-1515]
MTQSSMLQSLPAPLRSILRDPTAIAVLASIGVHGLLWAIFPYLPLAARQPTEAEIQREVGLVELSPEELARVPQFDTQASLPIPAAPLPPADAGRLPQQFSVTPLPTPPAGSLFPPSSLYVPPSLGRLPQVFTPNRPRVRSTTPTTRQTPRATPTPTPTPTPTATPTPTPTPTPLPPPTPGETVSEGGTSIDNVPPLAESPTPSPTATPSPNAGTNNGSGTNSESPPESPASPTPDRPSQEEIARRRAQEQEARRVARLLTPYPAGSRPTSQGDANRAFGDWFYVGNEGRTLEDLRRAEISVRYPAEACPIRATATVIYGVDVNADDRIVGDPQLLSSSRYPVFDEAALAAVRRYNFDNTTSEEQPFQVTVTFPFSAEACAAAAPEEPPAS